MMQKFSKVAASNTRNGFAPGAGVSLFCCETGAGEPVIMLHGFPEHSGIWYPLQEHLGATHHTIAPDLRGYGHSEKPPLVNDYDIDLLVADVVSLITYFEGPCSLVGHDWGGMLAWVVAARHPELIDRLVVLNAPHPCLFARALRDDVGQKAASAYVDRLISSSAEENLAANDFEILWNVVAPSVSGGLQNVAYQRELYRTAWSRPGALRGMLNWYRAVDWRASKLACGFLESVPRIAPSNGRILVPTLVLWGMRDGSFSPSVLDGLDAFVPELTIHRIDNGGHWLLREQPVLARTLIAQFLVEQ